jgi:enoyl-[acyl-carrier protein] reductase II
LQTRATRLLGIKYPIFQGAMAWVSLPPLVAAVSNAGGLGTLCGSIFDPDGLLQQIRQIKAQTERPFAVNLMANAVHLDALMDVIVDQGIVAVTYGVGNPHKIIQRAKAAGILCIPVVGSVQQAVRAERDGADAIVVAGMEGGGHVGHVSTMAMLPQVVDRVKAPVLAAGGIADGRGLAAVLTIGAEGVQMGSRFIVTKESPVPLGIKQRIIRSHTEDTVITGNITGIRCRVLRNRMAEKFLEMEATKESKEAMMAFGYGKMHRAFVEGDDEEGSVMVGEACGLIDDIPTCAELMQRMVDDAHNAMRAALARTNGYRPLPREMVGALER